MDAMTGWIVAAVLAALAIWPVMRLLALQHDMRSIAEQLDRRRREGSDEPLEVSARDDALERLAAAVECTVDEQRAETAEVRAREARLRREIADISHDLKTPLIAVRGYLQLVRRDAPRADASRERLETVLTRVDDLSRLVDDFFELSVLDSQEHELELVPVDATAVVGDELAGLFTAFEARGLEPEVHLPAHPLRVMADETALARVVRNLVANALSYTTGGVRVELAQADDRSGRARLVVSNGARGMDESTVPLMFGRFYRADRARTRPHAGLGLAIVRELVGQMGGAVDAHLDGSGDAAELSLVVELAEAPAARV